MMFPLALERKFIFEVMPQVRLWALKSPQSTNGEGSDRMRAEMSLEEVLWEGGM